VGELRLARPEPVAAVARLAGPLPLPADRRRLDRRFARGRPGRAGRPAGRRLLAVHRRQAAAVDLRILPGNAAMAGEPGVCAWRTPSCPAADSPPSPQGPPLRLIFSPF